MDEVVEALEKYKGLVPLVYDIETMGLVEARPQDMPYAVYLKREADKVIAEKDKEIRKWKAARDGCEQQFQAQVEETGKYLSQALELKYKRCLDKAKWCDERISRYTLQQEIQGISWQKEIKFYRRLKDKYIEISNRFKGDT